MTDSQNILFTGFEPFTTGLGLELDDNPTGKIAVRVAEQLPDALGVILPVSFRSTKIELEALFEEHSPTHWVGMGYAPHRIRYDVEVFALNMEHAESQDNDGESPRLRPIWEDGSPAYQNTETVGLLVEALEGQGVSAYPCFHAGTFLCNQTFYLASHRKNREGGLKTATFLHVPPADDYAALEKALVHFASLLGK